MTDIALTAVTVNSFFKPGERFIWKLKNVTSLEIHASSLWTPFGVFNLGI